MVHDMVCTKCVSVKTGFSGLRSHQEADQLEVLNAGQVLGQMARDGEIRAYVMSHDLLLYARFDTTLYLL